MDIINIEQISKMTVDDDCIAVVCYVDVKNITKTMALAYMKKVSDELTELFSDQGVKVLVLPAECRLEILSNKIVDDI